MKAHFIGDVDTRWITNDSRKMRTLAMLMFVDANGKKWVVPRFSVINGASIPRIFWIFGSPYCGKYRRATVIHDYYCDTKERTSKEVHRMFYEAMICDGVNPTKAKFMYQMIKLFGPDWK